MNQNLHCRSADRVEGAEDIQGVGGTEPEDGLALIQHDEGLWTESHERSGAATPRPCVERLLGGAVRALGLWLAGERGEGLREGARRASPPNPPAGLSPHCLTHG